MIFLEAARQRDIDAARELMAHIQNAQYERALKAWVSSDVKALLQGVFSLWHDKLVEAAMLRDIASAREQMAHNSNAQYERALQQVC